MEESKADMASTSAGAFNATPEYNSISSRKTRLQSTLAALLNDPVLADVPKKPTLFDVDTLINLELGSAKRISVRKLDGTSIDVAVMNSATVKDLKLAIKKKVNDMEESRMGHRHVSWKHVWANFCLLHHNEKLLNDDFALEDYGLRNNSQHLCGICVHEIPPCCLQMIKASLGINDKMMVQFIPYVVSRASRKHTRSRKHRFFHGLTRKA